MVGSANSTFESQLTICTLARIRGGTGSYETAGSVLTNELSCPHVNCLKRTYELVFLLGVQV